MAGKLGADFNSAQPADSDPVKNGAGWIRDIKSRLKAFLGVLFNLETGQLKSNVIVSDNLKDLEPSPEGTWERVTVNRKGQVTQGERVIQTINTTTAYSGFDAGSGDQYVVSIGVNVGAYFNGMKVRFRANTANTGAASMAVEIPNLSGSGTITLPDTPIVKNLDEPLLTGDIQAQQWVEVIYNSGVWQLVSPVSSYRYVSPSATALVLGDNNLSQAHGLGSTPTRIGALFRCVVGNASYAAGDVVPADYLGNNRNEFTAPPAAVWADATNIHFRLGSNPDNEGPSGNNTERLRDKGSATGATSLFTRTSWEVILYAEV